MEAIYDKTLKKQMGSFYSPSVLAHYLASKIQHIVKDSVGHTILDPAVGDGELLVALKNLRNCDSDTYIGIDIDEKALSQSSGRLPKRSIFLNTNALSPFGEYKKGWRKIKELINQHSFDIIISNPPWGTNIESDIIDLSQFKTAQGQFDIFDLFIEESLDLLEEGGVYGFIVPDSIFRQEHHIIREKLLTETSIRYITRIGEFFFEGVNTPVSVFIGAKGYRRDNLVSCMNISNSDSKKIIYGDMTFEELESTVSHERMQDSFISDNCNISIDIMSVDERLIATLDSKPRLRSIMTSYRGVELSKKGNIIRCPSCDKWMPQPSASKLQTRCPFCDINFVIADSSKEKIINSISKEINNVNRPFIAGEDMERYKFKVSRQIQLGHDGINYKPISIYNGPKILVRKTGVGITACLDYGDNLVNQVVYILTVKESAKKLIPIEFCIALLNSRLITYYIIKKYSSNKWCTHPYLSQDMVMSLPMPDFSKFENKDWNKIKKISDLVSKTYHCDGGNISTQSDIMLERLIFDLFRLDKSNFDIVMNAIKNVEQLIPFKRLLNISEEKWDTAI